MAILCRNCGNSIEFQELNEKKPDGSPKWLVLNAETKSRHICPLRKTKSASKYCDCGSNPRQLICYKCGKPKEFCPICRKRIESDEFHLHQL